MENTEDYKSKILSLVNEGTTDSETLTKTLNVSHDSIVGSLKSLENAEMIVLTQYQTEVVELTTDGIHIIQNGSEEYNFLVYLSKNGNTVENSQLIADFGSEGVVKKLVNQAKKANQVTIDGTKVTLSASTLVDDTKQQLESVQTGLLTDAKLIASLKKAKLIKHGKKTFYKLAKGPHFSLEIKKLEPEITLEQLRSGEWRNTQYKPFNYATLGTPETNGALHPLMKTRTQFREILLELGFNEMPTNKFVESSFWNFDALFQPQQHPARDSHDTFFLSKPEFSTIKDTEYFEKVRKVHEEGGYGSIGWRYDWSGNEALKNILRTHTTSISSQMLYKLAKDYEKTGVFSPKKYFSIDRVFRNESIDSTHLAEFHQVEGLIADYDLGLGNLIATIENFFHRIGIKKLRFKPAYNPYTEPSMEIFSYHEGLKRWVEIGNSGIFRPEMLKPMGLPDGVNVIAWGLSLERPTMIHYGLNNIRSLFGHEVQITNTKKNSLFCLNL